MKKIGKKIAKKIFEFAVQHGTMVKKLPKQFRGIMYVEIGWDNVC